MIHSNRMQQQNPAGGLGQGPRILSMSIWSEHITALAWRLLGPDGGYVTRNDNERKIVSCI